MSMGSLASLGAKRPVPAVHKLLLLPPHINKAFAAAGAGAGASKDFCFDILPAPHRSFSAQQHSTTTAVVVVGCGLSFSAYEVAAQTTNGSLATFECVSLWHVGHLPSALRYTLYPTLTPIKSRGMLSTAGQAGLLVLAQNAHVHAAAPHLIMISVESAIEIGRAAARKSLGGMPQEQVDVDVEVARLEPQPLATQFGT